MRNVWCVNILEYFSALQEIELLKYVTACVNLHIIKSNERNQTQRGLYTQYTQCCILHLPEIWGKANLQDINQKSGCLVTLGAFLMCFLVPYVDWEDRLFICQNSLNYALKICVFFTVCKFNIETTNILKDNKKIPWKISGTNSIYCMILFVYSLNQAEFKGLEIRTAVASRDWRNTGKY